MKNLHPQGARAISPFSSKAELASFASNASKPIHSPAYSDQSQQAAIVVLRGKQVDARLGISRSSRYDKLNPRSSRFDPTFPKPIKLGATSIGFIQSEINEWISSRISASRSGSEIGRQAKFQREHSPDNNAGDVTQVTAHPRKEKA